MSVTVSTGQITETSSGKEDLDLTFNDVLFPDPDEEPIVVKQLLYTKHIDNSYETQVLSDIERNLEDYNLDYNGVILSNKRFKKILPRNVNAELPIIINALSDDGICGNLNTQYFMDRIKDMNSLTIAVMEDTGPEYLDEFIVGVTVTQQCDCIHIASLCSNRSLYEHYKHLRAGKKMMRLLQIVAIKLEIPCIVLEALSGAEEFYLKTGFLFLSKYVRGTDISYTLTQTKDDNTVKNGELCVMIWFNPRLPVDSDIYLTCPENDDMSNFIKFYINNRSNEVFTKIKRITGINLDWEIKGRTEGKSDKEFTWSPLSRGNSLDGSSEDNLFGLMGSPPASPRSEVDSGIPTRANDYKSGIDFGERNESRHNKILSTVKNTRNDTLNKARVSTTPRGTWDGGIGTKKKTRRVKRRTRRVKKKSKKQKKTKRRY